MISPKQNNVLSFYYSISDLLDTNHLELVQSWTTNVNEVSIQTEVFRMNQNNSAAKYWTDDCDSCSPPLPALVAGFVQCVLGIIVGWYILVSPDENRWGRA